MMLVASLGGYVGLLRELRAYFARPLTVEQAKATVAGRIAGREELFLAMARARFFQPDGTYRQLLDLARCTYRDLEVMVRQRGIEGTLQALHGAGVYLSFEEFTAGLAVRQEQVLSFSSAGLDGRRAPGAMAFRTGGTRSAGRWVSLHIDNLAEQSSPQYGIILEMLADPKAPVYIWQLGFPSGAAVASWFALARLRRPPRRWFSLTPVPRTIFGPQGHHRMYLRTAHRLAHLAGVPAPLPEFTPVGSVGRVADAILTALREEGRCVLFTTPSCAVRLAAEAQRRGASLRGAALLTGGEPLTSAKAAEVERLGGRVAGQYASMEAGLIGAPCAAPIDVDDLHFRRDALAMITVPRQVGGETVETLMLTSLLPTAPRLMLNVEVDDFAVVEERACGCVWEELGCRPHLRGVRSFTKLTGEGTTLVGTNAVHIVERVLPEAFGGSSTDYQLVEAEDEHHLTGLFLLVSPRVGPLNERAVILRFTEALQGTKQSRPGTGGMRQVWEQAKSLRVLRREPIPTKLGKLLPFHTLGAAQKILDRGSRPILNSHASSH